MFNKYIIISKGDKYVAVTDALTNIKYSVDDRRCFEERR